MPFSPFSGCSALHGVNPNFFLKKLLSSIKKEKLQLQKGGNPAMESKRQKAIEEMKSIG